MGWPKVAGRLAQNSEIYNNSIFRYIANQSHHVLCSNNSVFTLLTQSIKTHVFLWKHLIILGISFFSYMYVLRRLCAFALQCHYFLLLVKSTKTKRRCWGILGRLYIASENPFPFTHWLHARQNII